MHVVLRRDLSAKGLVVRCLGEKNRRLLRNLLQGSQPARPFARLRHHAYPINL